MSATSSRSLGKRILGLDPGSRITGFGLIELNSSSAKMVTSGSWKLGDKTDLSERLWVLSSRLQELVQVHQPTHFAIEKVFLGKSVESSFILGHARGILFAVAGQFQIPVFEYATRQVKKSVTGFGGAEKQQVQLVLRHIYKIPQFESFDASDALAVAHHHTQILMQQQTLKLAVVPNILPRVKLEA